MEWDAGEGDGVRRGDSGFSVSAKREGNGARSSSGELRSSFVGAFKFLIPIRNLKDAQLLARPCTLPLNREMYRGKRLVRLMEHGREKAQTMRALCGGA